MTEGDSHQSQVATGIRRLGLLTVASSVLQLLQLLVVARWVGPQPIGVMTMVLAVSGFVLLLQDVGTSNALIRQPDLRKEQVNSVFLFQAVCGLLICALANLLAPSIAGLMAEPQLAHALRLYSPVFVITALGMAANALLERDLEFRIISVNEFAAAFAGVLVTVVLAWSGAGLLALIGGQFVMATLKTGLNLYATRKSLLVHLGTTVVSIRQFLDFGVFHMGQRLLNFVSSNLDYVLVGRLFGAESLGIYAVVFNLANVGTARISPIFSRVFFPAFVKFAHDRALLAREYFAAQHVLAALNFPLGALMIALAPLAVPLFLGQKWAGAVVLLQILTIAASLRGSAGATGALILSVGRTRRGFGWSIFSVALIAPCLFAAGAFGDLTWFGLAILFSTTALWFLSYPILVREFLDTNFVAWLRTVTVPLAYATAAGIVAFAFALALRPLGAWAAFAIASAAGCLACWLLVRRFDAAMISYFSSVVGLSRPAK